MLPARHAGQEDKVRVVRILVIAVLIIAAEAVLWPRNEPGPAAKAMSWTISPVNPASVGFTMEVDRIVLRPYLVRSQDNEDRRIVFMDPAEVSRHRGPNKNLILRGKSLEVVLHRFHYAFVAEWRNIDDDVNGLPVQKT